MAPGEPVVGRRSPHAFFVLGNERDRYLGLDELAPYAHLTLDAAHGHPAQRRTHDTCEPAASRAGDGVERLRHVNHDNQTECDV
jgi:hypothetical protein